jgi:5-methylcytosine-specific restriction endonuclease McrA
MGLFDLNAETERMLYGKPKKKRTTISTSIKKEVLVRQKYKCYKCKKMLPATRHFHHKKSVASGGKNTLSNIIALCPNCHSAIHHKKQVKKASSKARGRRRSDNPFDIDLGFKF